MYLTKVRSTGFTLVEIMIVVAIIGLLAAIAIPNFVKARTASQRAACIANLKQIEGAKATWALENKKTGTDTPTTADLYGPTKYIRDEPSCPAGGTYSINAVDARPTCNVPDHTL
ncbi:MAG TPA: prepilin-type N-terminal cleavage/methylation domain-containing protein [Gemmataceae bacterium]|jgi:prepilin-type N-terminal cleavage/methylation domain-containing protein|nr:prepilin-type N-terminal cleavage/methylation domain-containing protein [Gemmataceae bacterium]